MSYIDIPRLQGISIEVYRKKLCDDVRECLKGHAPNRQRLLSAIAYTHVYLKGSNPLDPEPIFLTQREWKKYIREVNDLYPHLGLFNSMSRAGRFGTFSELVELNFLLKIPHPLDRRGYLYAFNVDKANCSVCVSRKWCR